MPQAGIPISPTAAKILLKERVTTLARAAYINEVDANSCHRLASQNGQPPPWEGFTRAETTALQQLRLNRAKFLQATRHRWNLSDSARCPHCGAPDEDTAHFLCVCPKWMNERIATIGASPDLGILQTDPINVVSFLKRCALI